MTMINRIDSRTAPGALRPARRTTGGFGVPRAEIATEAPLASVAAGVLAGLDAVMAMQERDEDASADRRARRRGNDLLAGLTRVQAALLHPDGVTNAELARLADLQHGLSFAADIGLRDLLASIGLRARIELVRRGHTG